MTLDRHYENKFTAGIIIIYINSGECFIAKKNFKTHDGRIFPGAVSLYQYTPYRNT